MSNQLVLTFAGDPAPLSAAFATVGSDADRLAEQTTASAHRMGEAFEGVSDQSSLLSGGIGDIGGALTEAFGDDSAIGAFGAQMERASAIITGVTGAADLLSFANNNLRLAQIRAAAAQRIQTAATWASNSALLASPLTWIVVGILAVVAAIVLIATKTDWFQRAWRNSWGWIKTAASNTWSFIKSIPGAVASAFSRIGTAVSAPFKSAFNAVSRAWNSTVGSLSWTVPSWVPFVGGNTISAPRLPTFHSGGIIPGIAGTAVPFMGIAGERVSSLGSSGGGGTTMVAAGDELVRALLDKIAAEVGRAGGDPKRIGIRTV